MQSWFTFGGQPPPALAFVAIVLLGQLTSVSTANIYHRMPQFNNHRHDQLVNPKIQFENAYRESVGEVRTSFNKHADNFDEFFREILKVSHSNFHRMFSETYGILYDRHSSIFNDMFRDLEYYYKTGAIDITLAMRRFFSLLYKKMFEELNAQYAFDASYLNCTVEHMEEMMPFGELPQKLIHQIKRSFIAIRAFVQALSYGDEILKTIMELPVTGTCENRLKTISYCRRCDPTAVAAASTTTAVCQSVCSQSIEKACLPLHHSLNREWNQFLNDITKLASRLKTSFNIELVVKPINIKISEAIMIFQENGVAISQRLFSKCGRPIMRKHDKRSAYSFDDIHQSYPNPLYHHPSTPLSAKSKPPLNIDHLINELVRNFKTFKNFWSRLPSHLCFHYSSHGNCRNQTQRHSETHSYSDKNNIEIINQQIGTLKLISTNLNNAYNGLDVDLESNFKLVESGNMPIDDEEIGGSGESSGSGDYTSDDEDAIFKPKPAVIGDKSTDVDIYIDGISATGSSSSTTTDNSLLATVESEGDDTKVTSPSHASPLLTTTTTMHVLHMIGICVLGQLFVKFYCFPL